LCELGNPRVSEQLLRRIAHREQRRRHPGHCAAHGEECIPELACEGWVQVCLASKLSCGPRIEERFKNMLLAALLRKERGCVGQEGITIGVTLDRRHRRKRRFPFGNRRLAFTPLKLHPRTRNLMAEAGEYVDCGSLRGNIHGETGLVCLKGRRQAKDGGPEDGVSGDSGSIWAQAI